MNRYNFFKYIWPLNHDQNSFMKKFIVYTIALGLFGQGCIKKSTKVGQQPLKHRQNISADVLWKLGRVSDPKISPDGKEVLYGIKTANIAANKSCNFIYKLEVKGGTPLQLTDSTDNANSAQWRPDGKKIGYLSAKGDGMQLWEMNPDGTSKKQITHVKDGVDLFQYSPDMKHLLYSASTQVDPTIEGKYP